MYASTMDEGCNKPKIVSLKNLTDGQGFTLNGPGEYIIGLTAEDQVKSGLPGSENIDDIIVPLFKLTVWKTSGATVAPVSKDLPCMISGEPVGSEVNLIAGSIIEVGDKQLEFVDGPVAAPRRRCLPQTPGRPIHPKPPPKPQRTGTSEDNPEAVHQVLEKPPPMFPGWVMVDMPSTVTKDDTLKQIHEPEQLASLSASYLTKHVHFHTDACVNAELTDQIFTLMLEVANHRRDILQNFISGLIAESDSNVQEETKESEPPHAIFVALLREILQQFLDPVNLVVVSLRVLRAMSHMPDSAMLLVAGQVTSAVLGSMAALKSAVMVQQYSLDILAKIATYHPQISEKAPLRESAIDLICLSLEAHQENMTIAQAGCRVLSTLANTLYTVITHNLDHGTVASNELQQYVLNLFAVMEYLFLKCVGAVQKILHSFGGDLTIKCDSRHFFFIFSKLEHLRKRQEQWITMSSLPVAQDDHSSSSEDVPDGNAEEDGDASSRKGIMKRLRSFENLRTREHKVKFEEDNGSSSSWSSSASLPLEDPAEGMQGAVEISSQQLVCTALPKNPSNSESAGENDKNPSDISSQPQTAGCRPEADGLDSTLNYKAEYENWDSLLGVHHRKASLEGHSYSSGDIFFLRQLTKTQVLVLVFSLAVDSKQREALNLIEEPLVRITKSAEVPLGIQQFIKRQYQGEVTLMDLDPGLVVSIIDAVRYKSLALNMAQKSVHRVAQMLDDSQHSAVVDVGVEFLRTILASRPLAPAVTAEGFVEQICKELERASAVSKNQSALKFLLSEIEICAKKSSES